MSDPHDASAPEGTYRETCGGCKLTNGKLTCKVCTKPCGARVTPKPLDMSDCILDDGDEVINTAGQMTCKKSTINQPVEGSVLPGAHTEF